MFDLLFTADLDDENDGLADLDEFDEHDDGPRPPYYPRPPKPPRVSDEAHCGGCAHTPHHLCAACGAPTAVVLPAGRHALTLCAACYAVVLEFRAEQHISDEMEAQLRQEAKPYMAPTPGRHRAKPKPKTKTTRSRRRKVAVAA